jgi:hypothetical protein
MKKKLGEMPQQLRVFRVQANKQRVDMMMMMMYIGMRSKMVSSGWRRIHGVFRAYGFPLTIHATQTILLILIIVTSCLEFLGTHVERLRHLVPKHTSENISSEGK